MSYDNKQNNGGWPSEPQAQSPPAYGQPPQQWGPPQQQQWGPPSQQWAPPSGQWGPPQPSPGPQGSQQWGPPPQGDQKWAPAPQQGDRQWGPPQQSQQWGPPSQQNQQWGQQQQWNSAPPRPPPQAQSNHVTFRFGGTKSTILNTTVTDQYGRPVFNTSSDKKHTQIYNHEKNLVASVDWNHSSPVLNYQGREEKVKKWMPINKRKTGRVLTHGGAVYEWVENAQKTNDLVGPDGVMATWHDDRPGNDVDVSHKALQAGLLEPIIISIVCLMSGKKLGDGGSDDSYIFGGAVAVALNAFH